MPESMDASATRPNKLSISADGRILASGQSRSAIHLWDLETMRSIDPPLERHEEFVEAIAFMPDGKSLVAMEEYGRTVVWDLETSRQRRVMDFGDGYQPTRIDLSPDGRLLATGAERGEIKLWNVESGEEVGSIPAILGRDDGAIRFSPSGRMLASVSRSAWENRPEDESAERRVAVELWDVESRELVGRLYQPASESLYNGLAFSPDGRSLLAVDQDKPVRIWDIETGALKQKLEMHVMRGYAGLAVSPDFKILASGGPTRATPGFVGSSAMSTAFDHRIHLWSLETGELLREIGLHGNEPSLLHFTPDGRRLLSGMTWSGDEPWVNVFDLERNRVVLRLEHDPDLLISRYPNEGGDLGASPLAVSPDGKTAATGMINGTILIWDLAREDPPDARR
jgi:WD40 repeat protein